MGNTNVASMESPSSTVYLKRTTFSIQAVVFEKQRTNVGDSGFFWAYILWTCAVVEVNTRPPPLVWVPRKDTYIPTLWDVGLLYFA